MTEHSGLAAQFLAAARWVREQGFSRVFVDNLFSATELMELREPARYLSGEVALMEDEMDAMLATAEEMREALVASTPRRASIDR